MEKITLANIFEPRRSRVVEDFRISLAGSRVCLVNFATGTIFEEGQRLQNSSAALSGEFDFIRAWSKPRLMETEFYQENKDILELPRGAGCWLWKPYIIGDAISFLKDGDFVIYCDTGLDATRSIDHSIFPLCAWLAEKPNRIGVTHLSGYKNLAWTKRDCFFYMDCNEPGYWEVDQIQASYVALQINPYTRSLVKYWVEASRDRRIITDDTNVCGLDDHPEFIEHRHDQSILTNLILKYGFEFPRNDSALALKKNINDLLHKKLNRAAAVAKGFRVTECRAEKSSLSFWSPHRNGASLALDVQHPHAYAFHTDREHAPWWMARFKECKLSEIQIRNRVDAEHARAASLCVEVETAPDQWVEVFDAKFMQWNLKSPIILELSGIKAQGVRVSLRAEEFLHLHSVGIFSSEPHIPRVESVDLMQEVQTVSNDLTD
ncbi:hypothetical protein G3T14_04035 [Methylobacterium sp. BTF04]|uniref:hypothetical protein n=1 Tax=Methylobacterium sp. BTF04 TaxID=2708300 RepID=UPI0013D75EFD|nr:hypothetical protein [Methylobacterium sp. BTF04]NEU11294.1 hypothetical protein [Methylobacterium sp. BTF04]